MELIKLLIRNVKLVSTVYNPGTFPNPVKVEIAFAGRSNVGKSTLLNVLFNKKIAKVSSTPGKTRSINFYLVNNEYYFVDLPGYGYAKVSKSEKKRWAALIEYYFKSRKISMCFLLMDMRHEPQPNDLQMVEWIKTNSIPFTVVLTKADKVKRNERRKHIEIFEKVLMRYGEYRLILFSSVTKEGLDSLLESISEALDLGW